MLADCHKTLVDLLARHEVTLKAYTEAQTILQHLADGGPVPPDLSLQLTLPNGSVVPMPAEMITLQIANEYVYQSAAFLGQHVYDLWHQIAETGARGRDYCAKAAEAASLPEPPLPEPPPSPAPVPGSPQPLPPSLLAGILPTPAANLQPRRTMVAAAPEVPRGQ